MDVILYGPCTCTTEYPKLSGKTFPVLLWREGPLKFGEKELKLYKDATGEDLDASCSTDEERDVLRTNKRLIEILLKTQGGRGGHGFYRVEDIPIEFNEWHLWSVHEAPKSAFSTNEVLCLNIKALTKIQQEIEKQGEINKTKKRKKEKTIVYTFY